MKKNKLKKCLVLYTVLFAVSFILFIQVFFWSHHKSYFWKIDGLEQSYPFFIKIGQWWRAVFRNIFIRHNFSLPMWDMSMGFGSDPLILFCGGCTSYLFNPFMLISAFVPSAHTETVFNMIVILQMYLAGVSFILFCHFRPKYLSGKRLSANEPNPEPADSIAGSKKHSTHGFSNAAILGGALCYVFSATMYIIFIQTLFGYLFILLPLIFLGLEKLRCGKGAGLYVVMLFLSFTFSYYFTFMMAFAIAGYSILSAFWGRCKTVKKAIRELLRILAYSVYACLMGAALVLPALIHIMGTDRLSIERTTPLFTDKATAGNAWGGFLAGQNFGTDDMLGFAVPAFLSLIFLFNRKNLKKHPKAAISAVIMTLMLFMPYTGHILNGFTYATNRWIFMYAFLIGYIMTLMFDEFRSMDLRQLLKLSGGFLFYEIMLFSYYKKDVDRYMLPCFVAIAFILFLYLAKHLPKRIYRIAFLLLLTASLYIPAYNYFSPERMSTITKLTDAGTAYESLVNSGGKKAVLPLGLSPADRYDTTETKLRNSSMLLGISSFDYYNSAYHNGLENLLTELGLSSTIFPNQINGVDLRSDLLHLFGVRYLIKDEKAAFIPYGYTHSPSQYDDEYELFEADSTSLITWFKDAVPRSVYEEKDAFEKQQLLMHSVVLEDEAAKKDIPGDESADDTPSASDDFENPAGLSIPYTITGARGNEYTDGTIAIRKIKGYLELHFERITGKGELYILAEGLEKQKNDIYRFQLRAVPSLEGVTQDEYLQMVEPTTKKSHMYSGSHTRLINFGYHDYDVDTIRIRLSYYGYYDLPNLKIYFEPDEVLAQNTSGLTHPSNDVSISDNRLRATVDTPQDGYVLISVPSSKGWSATVDGRKAEILTADTAFMALKLPAGKHEILLTYRTPYLIPGLILFAVLLAGGLALQSFFKRRSRT